MPDDKCERCDGKGWRWVFFPYEKDQCPDCKGTGKCVPIQPIADICPKCGGIGLLPNPGEWPLKCPNYNANNFRCEWEEGK